MATTIHRDVFAADLTAVAVAQHETGLDERAKLPVHAEGGSFGSERKAGDLLLRTTVKPATQRLSPDIPEIALIYCRQGRVRLGLLLPEGDYLSEGPGNLQARGGK